jgi:chloramphenicol O-acetyltransferase type A
LHKSLVAANRIEPFRYRILEGKVFKYEAIHASPTINREDGSFGFSYMQYHSEFETFASEAKIEIEKVRNEKGLKAAVTGENVIHYSSIPWIDFTSVSHARHFGFNDSCPKITFGKMTSNDNRRYMPVSVHAHHALMDGYHIGQFLEQLQILMNE